MRAEIPQAQLEKAAATQLSFVLPVLSSPIICRLPGISQGGPAHTVLPLEAFDEYGPLGGDLVPVEVLLHDAFQVGHATRLQCGVADRYSHAVSAEFGLHLERAALGGEQDVGEEGLGGDGQIAQGAAAQPGDGTRPGYKLAGLAGPGKLRRELSLVRCRTHNAYKLTLSGVSRGALVY